MLADQTAEENAPYKTVEESNRLFLLLSAPFCFRVDLRVQVGREFNRASSLKLEYSMPTWMVAKRQAKMPRPFFCK